MYRSCTAKKCAKVFIIGFISSMIKIDEKPIGMDCCMMLAKNKGLFQDKKGN